MKHVKWTGFGTRDILGYLFKSGTVHKVEDDDIADDMLTQPGENFEDVTPAPKPKRTVVEKKKTIKED